MFCQYFLTLIFDCGVVLLCWSHLILIWESQAEECCEIRWSSRKGASPGGRSLVFPECHSVTRPGRSARVAEARPGPPLSILPPPWPSSERSALYTARFESRLVFGVEQTGAIHRAPPIFQISSSFSVKKSVVWEEKCSLSINSLSGKKVSIY